MPSIIIPIDSTNVEEEDEEVDQTVITAGIPPPRKLKQNASVAMDEMNEQFGDDSDYQTTVCKHSLSDDPLDDR